MFPTKGINKYTTAYIHAMPGLEGKLVVDVPAGDGRASYVYNQCEARVIAFDLYPQYIAVDGVEKRYADMTEGLPIDDASVDIVHCQEGIEHVPDQLRLLREFNRILRHGGRVLITTPNKSNLIGRVSSFFLESELLRRMPPSELDSIWFSSEDSDKLYFGHIFLVGVQHLRNLAAFSGFSLNKRLATAISKSSLALAIVLYPLIVLLALRAYWWSRIKFRNSSSAKNILKEQLLLNISPKTALCKHIFWELEKELDVNETIRHLKTINRKHETPPK